VAALLSPPPLSLPRVGEERGAGFILTLVLVRVGSALTLLVLVLARLALLSALALLALLARLTRLLAGLLAGLTGLLAFLTLIGLLLTIFVLAAHLRFLLVVVDLLHRVLGSTDCRDACR